METDNFNAQVDFATDFIKDLFGFFDIENDVTINTSSSGQPLININIKDNEWIKEFLNDEGKAINALQLIIKMFIYRQINDHASVRIDINNWKEEYIQELIDYTKEIVEQVKEKELDFEFSPMNSFERRLVHQEVGKTGLFSYSVGENKNRRVIISLEKKK
ncbi:MAG: hypothetical protein LBI63_04815 [Candidatus Ancillula sp.]|jgi:spoIIIJ-associated protein|nr:hypothetical protein [Candidatus Ancillula sp.]